MATPGRMATVKRFTRAKRFPEASIHRKPRPGGSRRNSGRGSRQ